MLREERGLTQRLSSFSCWFGERSLPDGADHQYVQWLETWSGVSLLAMYAYVCMQVPPTQLHASLVHAACSFARLLRHHERMAFGP